MTKPHPLLLAPRGLALAATLLLAACASTPAGKADGSDQTGQERIGSAATAPLGDLNLTRQQIPAVLEAARQAPYARPAERDCASLARDVGALDAALGADLDTPPTPANPGMIERGADAAGDAAIDALRSTTEGVVPFRGWVRKFSGAESHAREIAAAIAAGTVRRAYLKGLGQAQGCAAPAAPRAPATPAAAART
ncbi:MAG: hypothetical protein JO224_08285 [Pelomonas sp.]|nr:hypothetical protein [Roseateles sp.]